MQVEKLHHRLAYLAAAAALLSVVLSFISWLAGAILGITAGRYLTLATVAILFAIYFLFQGIVLAGRKSWI